MKKILFLIGTRPEAVKLAPVILEFKKRKCFKVATCLTGQHKKLPQKILKLFKLKADFNLHAMLEGQSLNQLFGNLMGMEKIFKIFKPDLCFVQGDTSTALAGALVSFHLQTPVAHVEAGLRSGNLKSPFPEEMNRKLISQLATFHFAPTKKAVQNLKAEAVKKNIFMTGNTVVDAVHFYQKNKSQFPISRKIKKICKSRKKIILVTLHRRESFGKNIDQTLKAIKAISTLPETLIVYPVHHNPGAKIPSIRLLRGIKNIKMTTPLSYNDLLAILGKAKIIISDSGGIQEEAPSFRKRVLVTRSVTERMEGLKTGHSVLVGSNFNKILDEATAALGRSKRLTKNNPYGKGNASSLIVEKIFKSLK